MNSLDIRKKFFDFFTRNGHTLVPSSSLIPAQDPTLLFANAGMNQFKDVFLGKEKRSYTRAVSIQKCIRAGGKHNDLEQVGFTKRHLTFFEMMGNFSFGDYFKHDAIKFAWDFLTKEIGLSPEKLYASVYKLDDQAYEIWHKEIGLPQSKIVRLGEADNFWQMGDTGPCGPCTEIYIDRGSQFGCADGVCAPGCHCDRFLEIWNLVFMQFDRQPNGEDKPLAATGVDTGMGLERLCAIVQNKESVYDTDLFAPILSSIEELTNISYASADQEKKAAFRVLADHIRSTSFAIADGCTPSNEGRGYVLRKIIRRAALFSQKLGDSVLFPKLVPALIQQMGSVYPDLRTQEQYIQSLLTSEIEKFSHNLIQGQQILRTYFLSSEKVISGEQAFKLYDTYGFPLELTKVMAHEHNFTVDTAGFDQEMEKQRAQSGKKAQKAMEILDCTIDPLLITEFTGYDEHISHAAITGLIADNQQVESVEPGTLCALITNKSPFYVECGGQISDQGFITIGSKQAKLLGLKKIHNAIAALIEAPTQLHVGDAVTLIVDSPSRINTMKNHTATHLLQAALMAIVGKTVKQSGSIVTPDYLRFDFTHHENLSLEQITQIEALVNKKIQENIPVRVTQTTYKEALSKGVIAFFGEKYNPENVRVVEVPGFSAELCGGTHVRATGDIGVFKITEVSALSAGNRRIVALTGPAAVALFQKNFSTIKTLSQEYKVTPDSILDAIKKQKEQLKTLQLEVKKLKKQLLNTEIPQLLNQAIMIENIPFLYTAIDQASADELKAISAELVKHKPGFYVLVSKGEPRSHIILALAPTITGKIALKQIKDLLKEYGIQGGGNDLLFQGTAIQLPQNLALILQNWVKSQLQ